MRETVLIMPVLRNSCIFSELIQKSRTTGHLKFLSCTPPPPPEGVKNWKVPMKKFPSQYEEKRHKPQNILIRTKVMASSAWLLNNPVCDCQIYHLSAMAGTPTGVKSVNTSKFGCPNIENCIKPSGSQFARKGSYRILKGVLWDQIISNKIGGDPWRFREESSFVTSDESEIMWVKVGSRERRRSEWCQLSSYWMFDGG